MSGADTPTLGPIRTDGTLTCGRILRTDGRHCGLPATAHILWTEDMENGITCDAHAIEASRRWAPVDAHRIGADCTMPGAVWDFDRKCCRFDPPLAEERVLAESVPA